MRRWPARALAERIAANAPLSVAYSKELVAGAAEWTEAEGRRRQDARLDVIVASADAREGAEAFVQNRRPFWRGE